MHALTQRFELVKPDLKSVSIGGASGKVQVIATVVSLNTPVCDKETMKLNTLAKHYPDTQFFVVSKDLPFELAKFTSDYKVKNVDLVSSFRNGAFSRYYGTLIDNTLLEGLDARAVFVIDAKGYLVYRQVVKEITDLPDFNKLEQLLNRCKK